MKSSLRSRKEAVIQLLALFLLGTGTGIFLIPFLQQNPINWPEIFAFAISMISGIVFGMAVAILVIRRLFDFTPKEAPPIYKSVDGCSGVCAFPGKVEGSVWRFTGDDFSLPVFVPMLNKTRLDVEVSDQAAELGNIAQLLVGATHFFHEKCKGLVPQPNLHIVQCMEVWSSGFSTAQAKGSLDPASVCGSDILSFSLELLRSKAEDVQRDKRFRGVRVAEVLYRLALHYSFEDRRRKYDNIAEAFAEWLSRRLASVPSNYGQNASGAQCMAKLAETIPGGSRELVSRAFASVDGISGLLVSASGAGPTATEKFGALCGLYNALPGHGRSLEDLSGLAGEYAIAVILDSVLAQIAKLEGQEKFDDAGQLAYALSEFIATLTFAQITHEVQEAIRA